MFNKSVDPNCYADLKHINESYVGFSWGVAQPMEEWKAFMKNKSPELNYLELCCGGGAAKYALKALEAPHKIYQYEINEDCEQLLLEDNDAFRVFLGKAGNIIGNELKDFPDAHVIIASPPMPPPGVIKENMTIVKNKACPFRRVCSIIVDQALSRATLLFFCIEVNEEFNIKHNGETSSDALKLVSVLKKNLGKNWDVWIGISTVGQHAIPFNRKKLYIKGHKRPSSMEDTPSKPTEMPMLWPIPDVRELLIGNQCKKLEVTTESQNAQNLQVRKDIIKAIYD